MNSSGGDGIQFVCYLLIQFGMGMVLFFQSWKWWFKSVKFFELELWGLLVGKLFLQTRLHPLRGQRLGKWPWEKRTIN